MASTNPAWLSYEQAIEKLLAAAIVIPEQENVSLEQALNRVCASDIVAQTNVPNWPNSSMDGYAVVANGLELGQTLPVIDTILAGHAPTERNEFASESTAHAVRIMTGAPVPSGFDSVIMQENCTVHGNGTITVNQLPKVGENVRPIGNDIVAGSVIVKAGTRLRPAHLGLLASLGLIQIEVKRKLRIGVMSTGDEVVEPGSPLPSGCIYDANRLTILSLLQDYCVETIDYGIVPDEPEAITRAFTQAAAETDIIISSGGVSVGDADWVKTCFAEMGTINFWKVAIKPGKPFAFGQLDNTLFCGLPGNPVSAHVTLQKLVFPLIEKCSGVNSVSLPNRLRARLTHTIKRRPGRLDFQRAFLEFSNGEWIVTALPNQNSGVLSSLCEANCYLLLEANCAVKHQHSLVWVEPFGITGQRAASTANFSLE